MGSEQIKSRKSTEFSAINGAILAFSRGFRESSHQCHFGGFMRHSDETC